MTKEDIIQMSEEEINLHVARDIMKLDVRELEVNCNGKEIKGMVVYDIDMSVSRIPDYTDDLNLCYEVEEKIKEMGRQIDYSTALAYALDCDIRPFDLIHASPLARMRAALMCFIN